jgi:hypothetical protein
LTQMWATICSGPTTLAIANQMGKIDVSQI